MHGNASINDSSYIITESVHLSLDLKIFRKRALKLLLPLLGTTCKKTGFILWLPLTNCTFNKYIKSVKLILHYKYILVPSSKI